MEKPIIDELLDIYGRATVDTGITSKQRRFAQRAVEAIQALVDNQVTTGSWIVSKVEHCYNDGCYPTHFTCSECGVELDFDLANTPYCSYCGSRMFDTVTPKEEEERYQRCGF